MVNDENFGELLIEGLKEMVAIQDGEQSAAKVVRRWRFEVANDLSADSPADESPPEDEDDPDPRRRW